MTLNSFTSQAILILGMHRSGTSALAVTLNKMGIEMGNSLMPAVKGSNEQGFGEHEKIVEQHDNLLLALGRSWDDPRPLPQGWLESKPAVNCYNKILEILIHDFEKVATWGLKDPRLCRLLPLWKMIFQELNVNVHFIFIFRNPLEVAKSLEKRNNIELSHSLLLWAQHYLEALTFTETMSRDFISYDQLLSDDNHTFQLILKRLDLPLNLDKLKENLNPSLRHHKFNETEISNDSKIPQFIVNLFNYLKDKTNNNIISANEKFSELNYNYQQMALLFSPWLYSKKSMGEILTKRTQELSKQKQETILLTEGLLNAEALVNQKLEIEQQLDTALNITRIQLTELTKRNLELEKGLKEAQSLVSERDITILALSKGLEEAQALVAERDKIFPSLEKGLIDAQILVSERDEIIRVQEKELQEAQSILSERQEINTSTSARSSKEKY